MWVYIQMCVLALQILSALKDWEATCIWWWSFRLLELETGHSDSRLVFDLGKTGLVCAVCHCALLKKGRPSLSLQQVSWLLAAHHRACRPLAITMRKPTTRALTMPTIFQLLGSLGAGLTGDNSKIKEFRENFSLCEQPLHCRSIYWMMILEYSVRRVNVRFKIVICSKVSWKFQWSKLSVLSKLTNLKFSKIQG